MHMTADSRSIWWSEPSHWCISFAVAAADNKAWFMLERAVSDTERGDTEPGTAVVFML
jgi:hypothetical protein